jgi:hypothetical protein
MAQCQDRRAPALKSCEPLVSWLSRECPTEVRQSFAGCQGDSRTGERVVGSDMAGIPPGQDNGCVPDEEEE